MHQPFDDQGRSSGNNRTLQDQSQAIMKENRREAAESRRVIGQEHLKAIDGYLEESKGHVVTLQKIKAHIADAFPCLHQLSRSSIQNIFKRKLNYSYKILEKRNHFYIYVEINSITPYLHVLQFLHFFSQTPTNPIDTPFAAFSSLRSLSIFYIGTLLFNWLLDSLIQLVHLHFWW